jgi:manganese-dependent inorganic pyrophosphatase
VDYPKIEPGIFELREVVSRKKQLLPYLTHCLERMQGAV